MRLSRPTLLLAAAAVLEGVLVHRTAAPGGILVRRYALLAEIGGAWAAYVLALLAVRRLPAGRVALVVVLGAALRVLALSVKAPLSDDLYRYAWDGLVQSSGTDPYRFPPRAPQLAHLRVPWLWPPEWAGRPRQTVLNRPGVRTIYPPVAQAWFWLEHHLVPLATRDRGYEVVGLLLDLAVVALLLVLLRRAGRDPRWVAVYALCPLPVLESVQNAHVDTLAVVLVLLGLLALPRRPLLAVVAVTAAALVKVYPGVLLVLLVRRVGWLRTALVAGGLTVLSYLPHVLAVGPEVVGYLPGYLREEQYGEGSRYLLVGLLGVSGSTATLLVAVGGAALAGWALRAASPSADLVLLAVRLLAGLLLLATPVQPWYALLLLALATAAGEVWPVPLGLAAYPAYVVAVLAGRLLLAGRLGYGAAVLVMVALALRSRRRPAAAPDRPSYPSPAAGAG